MRILVIDYAGHPFQYDLSTELGQRGHSVVHAYSSSTLSPHAAFGHAANVAVEPISIGRPFERYRVLRRLRDEVAFGRRAVALARRTRPDRLLTSNVPLISLLMLWMWARMTSTYWVLWLQDLQAGLARLVTGRRGLVQRSLNWLEVFLVRRAQHVVAISSGFSRTLTEIGVSSDRVSVIENWAPLSQMPTRARYNAWSASHGLDDKFVFLYSGTLGMKHSPELLRELALEFADDENVEVVAVGEGPGADWLVSQPPPRPMQLGFQPFEDLPDVLASGDVLVVLLDPEAGEFSVPSKTLTYLCAARPILGAIPSVNAAAQVIVDRAHAGVVVDPVHRSAFRRAARDLVADDARRSRDAGSARNYAERAFDRRAITDHFEVALAIPPATTEENRSI